MRRGNVSERPWGLTLASFVEARAHGQLTLTADSGKLYCIAFSDGAVVGASSPAASDSVARVALTSQLVTAAQAPALARAVAAAPGRDEVDVIAEGAGLTASESELLRRRLLLQRVARTFAVERGGYTFGEQITVATMRGMGLDLAPAIFLGVRMNLSQDRLAGDLRRFGARFALRAGEVDAERFGFSEAERPILQALRIGTSLPELEAKRRDLEPRRTQAVIYALVVMGLCDGFPQPRSRDGAIDLAAAAAAAAATDDDDDEAAIARARTTTFDRPGSPALQGEQRRTRTISSMPPLRSPSSSLLTTGDIIAAGLALVEAGADHFALLGLPRDAGADEVHAAYVALVCQLQLERLPALEPGVARDAERLFACVGAAYAVLSEPARRAAYVAGLGGEGGEAAPAPAPDSSREPEPEPEPELESESEPESELQPIRASTAAERARAAAEISQRGMQALRREDLPAALALLTRAAALVPSDVDHAAQLAWARFCAAPDKPAIAADVCRVLDRAIFRSPKPVMARLYLGRVERMLGRVHEALHHFHEVLELEPGHAEATAEIRMLEPRQARR